jgi:GNAT superfamily N-acetyltransferase
VPLTRRHDLADFESGEPALDDWLKRHALQAERSGSAKVLVSTEDDGTAVVGYYALAGASITREEASGRAGHGQPDPIPAVLLGRLAVDRRHHGRGLGRSLLMDALARTAEAAARVGVRVFLVHALHDEAKAFYMRYGFEESPLDDLTLMMLMKDVRMTLRDISGT